MKILVTGAAAAAAVAAVLSAPAPGQSPGGPTLELTGHFDRQSLVVHKARPRAKGHGPADVIVFAARLTRDGEPFGRMEGSQVAVDARYHAISAHYTLLLPDGTIEVLGAATDRRVPGRPKPAEADPSAVVGGTGAYAGARGTFVLDGSTITVALGS